MWEHRYLGVSPHSPASRNHEVHQSEREVQGRGAHGCSVTMLGQWASTMAGEDVEMREREIWRWTPWPSRESDGGRLTNAEFWPCLPPSPANYLDYSTISKFIIIPCSRSQIVFHRKKWSVISPMQVPGNNKSSLVHFAFCCCSIFNCSFFLRPIFATGDWLTECYVANATRSITSIIWCSCRALRLARTLVVYTAPCVSQTRHQ